MGRIIQTMNLSVDYDEITRDDMPNEMFEEIYDICGKDVAVSLLENQCGVAIFVPARPFLKLERRLLVKEFDEIGFTTAAIRKVARKYKITEKDIREELKKQKFKNIPESGQVDIWGNVG